MSDEHSEYLRALAKQMRDIGSLIDDKEFQAIGERRGKELDAAADHIDALAAENANLRERVGELEKRIADRDRHEGEVFVNYHKDMGRA